jgi:two-component system, LuxR family, sensor kinase FixL
VDDFGQIGVGAELRTRTSNSTVSPGVLRTLALCFVVAIAYYGGVRLGMAITLSSEPVSTLWPPNNILLTALLFMPVRTWWAVLSVVFPAHIAAEVGFGVPTSMSACWYVSNSAEAILGALLLRHFLERLPRLDRARDVATLILVAGMLAPAATSFLDAAFVALIGWRYTSYWQVWEARTLSNSLAALTLLPLALTCAPGAVRKVRGMRRTDMLETAVLLAGLSAVSAAVFLQTHPTSQSPTLLYAPLPFLIWAAIRRGASVVAMCIGILAVFAIGGVLHGEGPFTAEGPEHAARALQTFLITAAASLMLLAGALAELRETRALALSRLERLNLALEAAKMGTWDWDLAQDRVSWTGISAGNKVLAVSESVASRELLKRVQADDRPLLVHAFTYFDGRECEAEFRVRERNGSIAWINTRGRAVADGDGGRHRMIGVYSDVTRRKSEEAQLIMQREQIARFNRGLRMGALSGSLAHELLQPLTAILSNAEAAHALVHQAPPKTRIIDDALADIIAATVRMKKIIEQMRSLFERPEPDSQRIDVNECIAGVMALERSFLVAHGVTAAVRLGIRLPTVAINAVLLQQVLINLIVNACDAMVGNPATERNIEIVSKSDEGEVEMVISDSGTGIENTEQIFEAFFTTKEHGIGLGLAISRMILIAHGGSLWATNNPTRGASLHISLPAASDMGDTLSAARAPLG